MSARKDRCTVCADPRVTYLNARALKGESFTSLAAAFDYNRVTIGRHVRNHLPPSAVTTHRPGRKPAGTPALPEPERGLPDANPADRLHVLVARLEGHMDAAAASGSIRAVTDVSRELRAVVRELAHLDEAGSGTAVDLATSAEWVAVRTALMQALAPHPEARRDVAAALARVGAGHYPEATNSPAAAEPYAEPAEPPNGAESPSGEAP